MGAGIAEVAARAGGEVLVLERDIDSAYLARAHRALPDPRGRGRQTEVASPSGSGLAQSAALDPEGP
ncbi:hypothetical protein ACFXG4_47955 [Nocardia sp. NPDC059246]|uniref:hypothetical protein n=1 Tax=unclassified Nocardia TaxID=2637762 RepID=UPI0036A6F385